MSTAEMMVSGAILCGVVVLSFETMVTSVKISADSVDTTSPQQLARTGLDMLTKDIQSADMSYGKRSVSGIPVHSTDNDLWLRQPVRDMMGNVVPGQKRIVRYFLKGSSGSEAPNNVYRESYTVQGSTVVSSSTSKKVMTNVQDLTFDYRGTAVISPAISGVPMIATPVPFGSLPKNAVVQLRKVKNRSKGIDINYDNQRITNQGSVVVLGNNNLLFPGALGATDKFDIEYRVDPQYNRNAQFGNGASLIKTTVKLYAENKKGETTLEQTFESASLMKNFKE